MTDVNAYFENIAELKFLAKKEVGQNFLHDSDVASRIVDTLQATPDGKVLEIGSGAGSLTYFLNQKGHQGDAIDIDPSFVSKLQDDFPNGSIHVIQGNAMKWDYSSYEYILGNLPYYITSGILEKVLLGAKNAKRAVFMVQKEAADRLLASYGDKDYSPLSILLSLSGSAKKEFKVGRDSFTPAPHVESVVFSFNFEQGRNQEDIAGAYHLACSLFLQRRKTIANNLKASLPDQDKVSEILNAVSLSPSLRPEQIPPEKYLELYRMEKSL